MKWTVKDIELAVGILLNEMIGMGERTDLDIQGHAISCYKFSKQKYISWVDKILRRKKEVIAGICVARAIQAYGTAYGIAYPLFLTFKIYDNTFELHYYDMIFVFDIKEVAEKVEKLKTNQK